MKGNVENGRARGSRGVKAARAVTAPRLRSLWAARCLCVHQAPSLLSPRSPHSTFGREGGILRLLRYQPWTGREQHSWRHAGPLISIRFLFLDHQADIPGKIYLFNIWLPIFPCTMLFKLEIRLPHFHNSHISNNTCSGFCILACPSAILSTLPD